MSFNKEDSVVDIIGDLIECIDICIENKELWKKDKTKMVITIAQVKPEFYAKRGRLVHHIVMYDDIKTLVSMLRKLNLAQQGKVDFKEISNEMTMDINKTFAPDATKEILNTIKNNNK